MIGTTEIIYNKILHFFLILACKQSKAFTEQIKEIIEEN